MDIPGGLHVNSNRPLGKFAIPTKVTVEAPRGLRVTPVTYPRGKVRSFPFAPDEKLAVYEGETVMRFNVTVPADYELGVAQVRVVVNYQSCTDEVCFPPQKAELPLRIAIVGFSMGATLALLAWLLDAITETGNHGAKKLAYLRAIVDRWKLDGREEASEPEDSFDFLKGKYAPGFVEVAR